MIPYIGPEFIAALRDKAALGRSKTVIGGSLMDQAAAKTTRALVALFIRKLRAITAKTEARGPQNDFRHRHTVTIGGPLGISLGISLIDYSQFAK